MNSKDIFMSYLLMLKGTVEVYIHGTIESANVISRDTLSNGLDETLRFQGNLFDKMTELGYYPIENTDASKINKVIKKLEKDL